MRKKVFISTAIWGRSYTSVFIEFNLASQLSEKNIPAVAKCCEVTYHILTTFEDKKWLEKQPLIQLLKQYAQIDWDYFDPNHEQLIGIGANKYSFLSVLQNIAMKKAMKSDLLIFNYADFVWSNGSILNLVHKFNQDIDAILTFCLPVDEAGGMNAMRAHSKREEDDNQIIRLSSRQAVKIALKNLHREAHRRYWDDKNFTKTPTYIIWPVEKEGVIITAYHQTILALRVNNNDPIYHNGIMTGSLDGYYSAILAANNRIEHADDSDEIFVFSLYDTKIDTASDGHELRENLLKDCLKGSITEKQRDFVFSPILVKQRYKDKNLWEKTKTKAIDTLQKIHKSTTHDLSLYCHNSFGHLLLSCETMPQANLILNNEQHHAKVMITAVLNHSAKLLRHLCAPKNLALNGNFNTWSACEFQYQRDAWVSLPAASWLGHFDGNANGTFARSDLVPNSESAYSIVISGVPGGSNVYLGQKIPAMAMLNICKTRSIFCRGYVRYEGDIQKHFSVNAIIPGQRDNYQTYEVLTLHNLVIHKQGEWQYFEFECKKINQKNLSNGLLFYFLMGGLGANKNKVYFSQIKLAAEKETRLKFYSKPRELWLKQKLNLLKTLFKYQQKLIHAIHRKPSPELKTTICLDVVPNSINIDNILSMLQQDRLHDLPIALHQYVHPLRIGTEQILASEETIYYWIGTLPERELSFFKDMNTFNFVLSKSEEALHKLISCEPKFIEGYAALARNLWLQGRYEDALSQFQLAEIARLNLARSEGIDVDAALILPDQCAYSLKLMGQLDTYIKMKMLRGEKHQYVVLLQSNEVANAIFWDYWKPFLQSSLAEDMKAAKYHAALTVNWHWAMPEKKGTCQANHVIAAQVQTEWSAAGNPPLLKLTDAHVQKLNQYKTSIGMNAEDWFVCLDIDSVDFYGNQTETLSSFRETLFEDYCVTIRDIVESGGWVLLFGKSELSKLNDYLSPQQRKQVIDYKNSREKSDLLDVVLSASCRLFISVNSALSTIASSFGRPVCYVNSLMHAGFPCHPNETHIPMLYYSLANHHILTLEEILSSNLICANFDHLIAKEHIILLHNTPDEIAETVREALNEETYCLPEMGSAISAKAYFDQVNKKYQSRNVGKMGLYFLHKHRKKLFLALRDHPEFHPESDVMKFSRKSNVENICVSTQSKE